MSFEPPDVNRGVLPLRAGRRPTRALRPGRDQGHGAGRHRGHRRGARGPGAQTAARPFRSLFDFCARVDRQRVNKRVVEALVKAGAFDACTADRAALLASVGLAFDWAETQAAHADQGGLFDFGDATTPHASTQEPALVAADALGHQASG